MTPTTYREKLARLFPFLNWPKPGSVQVRADVVAGITVGLVLIPQALAYAHLAGMPPVTGLYAALLPGIIGALFGSSSMLAVGPVALTSLLTFATLQPLAEAGSPQWVAMAIWLAIYSGLIQLLMGACKMGVVAHLISNAVVQGFISAAALIIILSQVPALLGFESHPGTSWLEQLQYGWRTAPLQLIVTTLFGGASIFGLFLIRRLSGRLPGVMIVCVLGIVVSFVCGFEGLGGSVVGHVKSGLPALGLPFTLSLEQHVALLFPALVIALISFTEAMSSCRVMSQLTKEPWNKNQELVGQGLAKIASGFSGAFPVSGSFSRTALNAYSGARTSWATIIASLLVMICLFGLTDILYHLPKAVLAAVIIVPVLRLINIRALISLARSSPKDGLVAAVTLATTLITVPDLYWGIIAGMFASVVAVLYRHAVPRIIELGLHESGALRDRNLYELPPIAADVLGIRMDASLTYLAGPMLESYVRRKVTATPVRFLLISASSLNQIDSTGIDTLREIWSFLDAQGTQLCLSGPRLAVREALSQSGLLQLIGEQYVFATDTQAVEMLIRLTSAEQLKSGDSALVRNC